LRNWYIGPRPLDPSQPIRTLPPLRDRSVPQAEVDVLGAGSSGGGEAGTHAEGEGSEIREGVAVVAGSSGIVRSGGGEETQANGIETRDPGIEVLIKTPPPPTLLEPPPLSPIGKKRWLEGDKEGKGGRGAKRKLKAGTHAGSAEGKGKKGKGKKVSGVGVGADGVWEEKIAVRDPSSVSDAIGTGGGSVTETPRSETPGASGEGEKGGKDTEWLLKKLPFHIPASRGRPYTMAEVAAMKLQ
jgi:hypothetical protein